MSKNYTKKTNRSRRKLQKLEKNAVKVDIADGQATFQMILPMNALMAQMADSTEQMASEAGLLMMKAMIDEEVEQVVGQRYMPIMIDDWRCVGAQNKAVSSLLVARLLSNDRGFAVRTAKKYL